MWASNGSRRWCRKAFPSAAKARFGKREPERWQCIVPQSSISLNQPSLLGGRQKIQFHLAVCFASDGLARYKDDIHGLLKIVLVMAKNLAHQSAGTRARHGVADLARCDHPKARYPLPFFCIRAPPIQYQATFDDALPFKASAIEFPAPLQPLGLREPERLTRWSLAHHVESRIKPESNVCDQRDGDWQGLHDRSCWNCG